MQVIPVKNNVSSQAQTNKEVNFCHKSTTECNYTAGQKTLITATSIIGVASSLAILSKTSGHSWNPFKGIKNSYFAKIKYGPKAIISIAAGSVLGGLAGGCMIDKDRENRKAKCREGLLQMGNASIPILTVGLVVDKIFAKANKFIKALSGLGGVLIGVTLANFIMNKVNNKIFKNHDERGVKATDYSAHVDDMVVAAQYVTDAKLVHIIGRLIPAALVIPGVETGKKQAERL